MRVPILTTIVLLGVTIALPSNEKRDKFIPCSTTGSNCITQDQSFCDPDTGKISVCHQFGSDCWIRYTQDACSAKREEKLGITSPVEKMFEKRDKFDKCTVFGANCASNGDHFCDGGHISVCEFVPYTDDCWVRYTATACSSKREAESDIKADAKRGSHMLNKRDVFDTCSNFGANCDVNGNQFCYNGIQSVCEQVPFTNDCWVRYTAESC